HPWLAPELVNAGLAQRLGTAGLQLLLLFAAVVAIDTVLLKALVALQLDVSTGEAWGTALGIGVVMLLPGFHLGAAWREHRATGAPLDPAAWFYGGAWLVLSVVLFVVRATASSAPTVAIPGVDTPADTDHHVVQACLLLAVQLLTGITAFFLAARMTNPEASGLRSALSRQRRVRRRLPEAEKLVTRLAHNVSARTAVLDQVDEAAETARRLQRNVGQHVKASARVRMAQLLGEPGDTSTLIGG
ncbi:MAG: hypothetical protein JHC71_19270, partial [Blastococcus sp.]|nr:hypothetical protein [Blastococcus sp.]